MRGTIHDEPPFYVGDPKPGGGVYTSADAEAWAKESRSKQLWMLRAERHFYRGDGRPSRCPHCPAFHGPCLTLSEESAIEPRALAVALGAVHLMREKLAA